MENSADKLTCVFDYFRVRCFKWVPNDRMDLL
jgi:hypothetical protein